MKTRQSPNRRTALAILAIAPEAGEKDGAALEAGLAALKTRLAAPPQPAFMPYYSNGRLILAYADVGSAAAAAVRLIFGSPDAPALRIGGDYAIASAFTEPFSGAARLTADAVAAASGAMDSAPPGTACVTEDFAAALAAAGPRAPASEYVGELVPPDPGPPIGLYALKSYDQLFQPMGSDHPQ